MALHVALIEPRIAPNTGNIARLCAATDTSLHLIEPFGFDLHDPEIRRSSVHAIDDVDLWIHPGWRHFRDAITRERCFYFSANATQSLWEARIPDGSVLVFGNETDGMPERILAKHPERCYRIPMSGTPRSLNLATAVGIVLYDTLKGLGYNPRAEWAAAPHPQREQAHLP